MARRPADKKSKSSKSKSSGAKKKKAAKPARAKAPKVTRASTPKVKTMASMNVTAGASSSSPPLGFLTCDGYNLRINNRSDQAAYDLRVTGSDGKPYFLQVLNTADDINLIKDGFVAMRRVWPDFDWFFKADPSGKITGFA